MVTSVMQALKNDFWCGKLTKLDSLPKQDLIKDLGAGNQTMHELAPIREEEIIRFATELDNALFSFHPLIKELFSDNAPFLVHLMRGVNMNTHSGFNGVHASGSRLDGIFPTPGHFSDPDNPGFNRTSWSRKITKPASLPFADINTNGKEGLIILGFANFALEPCTSLLQIIQYDFKQNIQNLSFDFAASVFDDPPAVQKEYALIKLKDPLLVFPNEHADINVIYDKPGIDMLTPVGLWYRPAYMMKNNPNMFP